MPRTCGASARRSSAWSSRALTSPRRRCP
jgi:hypothetical protein